MYANTEVQVVNRTYTKRITQAKVQGKIEITHRTKILYCNWVIKQVSSIHVYNYVQHRDAY